MQLPRFLFYYSMPPPTLSNHECSLSEFYCHVGEDCCYAGYPCCQGNDENDCDADGVIDVLDCDWLNPYVKHDLDQDGICDAPVLLEQVPACIGHCRLKYCTYSDTSGWIQCSPAYDSCEKRCQGPGDNCSPVRTSGGSYYPESSPYRACLQLAGACPMDPLLLQRCFAWFHNPDQTDEDGHGVGDHCERRITEVSVDIRSSAFGMNLGTFSWCPDPDATFSARLMQGREGLPEPAMLSVGLCACPGSDEESCRQLSVSPPIFHCPSDPQWDAEQGLWKKDFAWNADSRNFQYFYHPVNVQTPQDLGVLTSNTTLGEKSGRPNVDQGLTVRWKDVRFQDARVSVHFRMDRFQKVSGFAMDEILDAFPEGPFVPLQDVYSKVKFSSPRPVSSIPTNDDWNPQVSVVEFGLLPLAAGLFSYDEATSGGVCFSFPRPVGLPVGYIEGSPLPVDPLWDPPRDLLDTMIGWIPDEEGNLRLFTVDAAALKVRTYVALPKTPDLRFVEPAMLRLDAGIVGGAQGYWTDLVAVLDKGSLVVRLPDQEGPWTRVVTELPEKMTILSFLQAHENELWVLGRDKIFSPPTLYRVDPTQGTVLSETPITAWQWARVESMAASRQGEAYYLIRQPAHLHPYLWKLDAAGMNAAFELPGLFPPGRGALAVDPTAGKIYLVARAQSDHRNSLWVLNMVSRVWTRLSDAVPAAILREPRLVVSGGRLLFTDLKDGVVFEWTQGLWLNYGNPLLREVGP